MSGSTTESSQQEITSSGRKRRGNSGSSTPPEAVNVSFNQGQVGRRFGWVVVTSAERRYTRPNWRGAYVQTRCTGCGAEAWTYWSNLSRGKTNGCQACSQPRQIPKWLDRRLTAAKSRCTNPNDPQWHNYGGRGIEFRFEGVTTAGLWIVENLGLADTKMEIDRIDVNGHYEAGNLRWATRKQQNWNKRTNIQQEWTYREEDWPYDFNTVKRKLSEGWTRAQIIEQAREAVRMKRKRWRVIAERLASMTS